MNHIDDRWDPKIEIYEVPYVIENHNVVFRATKELLDPSPSTCHSDLLLFTNTFQQYSQLLNTGPHSLLFE